MSVAYHLCFINTRLSHLFLSFSLFLGGNGGGVAMFMDSLYCSFLCF